MTKTDRQTWFNEGILVYMHLLDVRLLYSKTSVHPNYKITPYFLTFIIGPQFPTPKISHMFICALKHSFHFINHYSCPFPNRRGTKSKVLFLCKNIFHSSAEGFSSQSWTNQVSSFHFFLVLYSTFVFPLTVSLLSFCRETVKKEGIVY